MNKFLFGQIKLQKEINWPKLLFTIKVYYNFKLLNRLYSFIVNNVHKNLSKVTIIQKKSNYVLMQIKNL